MKMLNIKFLVLFAVIISICGSTVIDQDISALLVRMAALEERVSKQAELESRIETLEAEMKRKDQQIEELRQQCDDAHTSRHSHEHDIDTADINTGTGDLNQIQEVINNGDVSSNNGNNRTTNDITAHRPVIGATNKTRKQSSNYATRLTKRFLAETPIAFTAALQLSGSHQDNVGIGQTIKFNKIVTNSGNAYNMHSGTFTAPMEGLYLFSFTFATGWDAERADLQLMVDSAPQVGGVATSTTFGQDIQGGNTAIVHMQPGQVAWIEAFKDSGSLLYADNGFSTFSGVLLYPL